MKGNPNYGLMSPTIVNDDESWQDQASAGRKDGGNTQGSRFSDWEWNEDGTEMVLKEDAITLQNDAWNQLSDEDQQTELNRDFINGAGAELASGKGEDQSGGHRVNGKWIPARQNERKATQFDHLLTSADTKSQYHYTVEEQRPIISDEDKLIDKRRLSKNIDEAQETLASEETETDVEYSEEDLVKIENYEKYKNQ